MKINKGLTEALKEGARVIVLAIIPVMIDSLGRGEINIQIILVTGVIALLRFLDKYLHSLEKKGVSGGLTRF